MLYLPSLPVTTDFTRSINAGLAASTVTPGRTAPDESVTVPAMPLACCADTGDASAQAKTSQIAHTSAFLDRTIVPPPLNKRCFQRHTPATPQMRHKRLYGFPWTRRGRRG
jgi:hypothetical protein